MSNSTSALSIDVGALNVTALAAVHAMFWGVIAAAVLVPIAAAGGGWVAEKITGSSKKKKRSNGYD